MEKLKKEEYIVFRMLEHIILTMASLTNKLGRRWHLLETVV